MSHIDINVCYLLTSVTFYSHVCSPITTIICTECKYTFVPLAYSAETPYRASLFFRSLNACWGLPASTQRFLEESQVAPCYHRSHTSGCPLEQKAAPLLQQARLHLNTVDRKLFDRMFKRWASSCLWQRLAKPRHCTCRSRQS